MSTETGPVINVDTIVCGLERNEFSMENESSGFQNLTNEVHNAHAFLRECFDIVLDDAISRRSDDSNLVLNFRSPQQLQEVINFTLSRSPHTHERLLLYLKEVIKYSVNTSHLYFMNQLFSRVDPYGLIGQWLGDALNCSVYTYEVAPVFTIMEEYVLAELRNFVGFVEGDGIFSPGGSIANGYAINCARYNKFRKIKERGLHALPRLVLFTSNDSHYSIKKLAAFEGIGSDNVYLVKTDKQGKMDVADLEIQIQYSLSEKAVPFMVSATSGTTVFGAYDLLPKIADVCKRYNLWFHVDAAWGGAVMFSKRHSYLIKGIERADSVTFNPHKMLTAPQQCSVMVTKHKNILNLCHSCSAQYLFQKDKFYNTQYDTGDKHIQCGRRADVLKFWLMWKAKGSEGLETHVDHVFNLTTYFVNKIQNRSDFKMVLDKPEYANICFWYLSKSLKNYRNSSFYNRQLNKIAPKIKEKMVLRGSMMITYQPLDKIPNFFRLVIQNPSLKRSNMDYILEELVRLGQDIKI